jgi:hypothetical protein
MWDDIAILARYLLMLSFNNCLDVARHLPYLFHTVTLLVGWWVTLLVGYAAGGLPSTLLVGCPPPCWWDAPFQMLASLN